MGFQQEPYAVLHELSYRRRDPSGAVHRARRRGLHAMLRRLPLPETGAIAEFGCSTGHILEGILQEVLTGRDWTCQGYDYESMFIESARARAIPNASFDILDLNTAAPMSEPRFDLVISVETFEHVGNVPHGIQILDAACKLGGFVVIGVPNEKRFPGLVKFLGRMAIRGVDTYGDFFGQPYRRRDYLWALLRNERLDRFRQPPREAWGPHLGFDIDWFEEHIKGVFAPPNAQFLFRTQSYFGFNYFWAFQKNAGS